MDITILDPPLASQPRPKGVVVDTIVVHATAGSTLQGAIAALRERGLGYHYLIDKDGGITKAVPTKRQAAHAGNSYGPQEAANGVSREQRFVRGNGWVYRADTSVNAYSIGISFVNLNDGFDPYTEEQIDSCRELLLTLKRAFPSLRWLTPHYGVSHRRKTDPRGLDIMRLAQEVVLDPWKVPEARWLRRRTSGLPI